MVTSLSAVAEAAKDCRVLIWNVGKRVRDERLVLDLCVGIVIALLAVLSEGPIMNPYQTTGSRQKETVEAAQWRPRED